MNKKKETKKIKIIKAQSGTMTPIPPFESLEEESNFWDTHSMVDSIDDGTLIGFHVANKTKSLTIHFAEKDIQKLRDYAFKLDIGPTDLARKWLKEKLYATE